MRIHDDEADRTLGSIGLFLTYDDIDQLIAALTALQAEDAGSHHQVQEREPALRDYIREINLVLYEEGNAPDGSSERVTSIILDDE
ncbi:MAG: hypothetical protein JXE06_07770 [Coriobacteriia bacterium]|nr:hypothetical protein [Coriobacteriia bacterium]MBN2822304.1 hypothetical protein [Coriobacteriia bacterium]